MCEVESSVYSKGRTKARDNVNTSWRRSENSSRQFPLLLLFLFFLLFCPAANGRYFQLTERGQAERKGQKKGCHAKDPWLAMVGRKKIRGSTVSGVVTHIQRSISTQRATPANDAEAAGDISGGANRPQQCDTALKRLHTARRSTGSQGGECGEGWPQRAFETPPDRPRRQASAGDWPRRLRT